MSRPTTNKSKGRPGAKPRQRVKSKPSLDYRSAGVDIDAGNALAKHIFKRVKSTYSDRIVPLDGGYAGLFSMVSDAKRFKQNYRKPVLAACTDSVGTKVKIAFAMNKHDTIGIDVVAMSVNDMLCLGAQPLFFLDYIGCNKVVQSVSQALIAGVIEGCKQSECALLGGETCEMPDIYSRGEYDLAGFSVGVVEESRIIQGDDVKPGDVVIGLPSSGVHSNGYTLARKALFEAAGYTHRRKLKELSGRTLGQALLEPTRIYVRPVMEMLRASPRSNPVKAMAHITGGGIVENLPRVLPKGMRAVIEPAAWHRHEIFDVIQEAGKVAEDEMYRVFNMGIGFILVVQPRKVKEVMRRLEAAGEDPLEMGHIEKGRRCVKMI